MIVKNTVMNIEVGDGVVGFFVSDGTDRISFLWRDMRKWIVVENDREGKEFEPFDDSATCSRCGNRRHYKIDDYAEHDDAHGFKITSFDLCDDCFAKNKAEYEKCNEDIDVNVDIQIRYIYQLYTLPTGFNFIVFDLGDGIQLDREDTDKKRKKRDYCPKCKKKVEIDALPTGGVFCSVCGGKMYERIEDLLAAF